MDNDNLKPVFYIIAHPDDWQIFCGHQVFNDVNTSGIKVVFIPMSSGDADKNLGKHWDLREKAAAYTCQLLTPGAVSGPNEHKISGHKVIYYDCGKAISYFLRVKEVELDVLSSSTPNVINTVDGCSTYNNLDDLKSTLYTIVNSELSNCGIKDIWINTHEYQFSDYDHDGHKTTGRIVNDLFVESNISFFRGYNIANAPVNICIEKIYLKRALLLAYSNKIFEETQKLGISAINDYVKNVDYYEKWLARYYTRLKTIH